MLKTLLRHPESSLSLVRVAGLLHIICLFRRNATASGSFNQFNQSIASDIAGTRRAAPPTPPRRNLKETAELRTKHSQATQQ